MARHVKWALPPPCAATRLPARSAPLNAPPLDRSPLLPARPPTSSLPPRPACVLCMPTSSASLPPPQSRICRALNSSAFAPAAVASATTAVTTSATTSVSTSAAFPPGQLLHPPYLPPSRSLLLLACSSCLSACPPASSASPPRPPTHLFHLRLFCLVRRRRPHAAQTTTPATAKAGATTGDGCRRGLRCRGRYCQSPAGRAPEAFPSAAAIKASHPRLQGP